MDAVLVRELVEGFLHSTAFAAGASIGLSYVFNIRPEDVRRKFFGGPAAEVKLDLPSFETVKVLGEPPQQAWPFAVQYEENQKASSRSIKPKKPRAIQEPGKQHIYTLLDGLEFRQDQCSLPSDFGQVLDAHELHIEAEQAWKHALDAVISCSIRIGLNLLVFGLIRLYGLIRWSISWLIDLKETTVRQGERITAQDQISACQDEKISSQDRIIAALNERIKTQGRTIASQDEKITAQQDMIDSLQQFAETTPDVTHDPLLLKTRAKIEQLQAGNTLLREDVDSLLTSRFTSHLQAVESNIRISALETSHQIAKDHIKPLEAAKRTKDNFRCQLAFALWTTYLPSHEMNEAWRKTVQTIRPWELDVKSPKYKRPITADDFKADHCDHLVKAFLGHLIRVVFQQASAIDMFARSQPRRGY